MKQPRIYQNIVLANDKILELDKAASHHLTRVLRMKRGEHIIVFNGSEKQYLAQITALSKTQVTIKTLQEIQTQVESPLTIRLAQVISRGEKMDFTIQKAVELGIKEIIPLTTKRCGVNLANERLEKRLAHWQRIIISSTEQCGRSHLPKLSNVKALNNYLDKLSTPCLLLHPDTKKKLSEIKLTEKDITIIIGSEGGFSDEEVTLAKQHGCQLVNIGPRILRTETAGIVASSILQSLYGDL